MNIFDNFIESYGSLKDFSESEKAIFKNHTNDIDGVVYPCICSEIPESVKDEISEKLVNLFGRGVSINAIFMRRSPSGVHVPHVAHTDNSMGRFSLMLYLFERENSGTAFIRHKSTGICYAPEADEFLSIVINDQNNLDKWGIVDMANAKENRAVIFDSGKFHCAMPIGGFGEGIESRTVLTVFFN